MKKKMKKYIFLFSILTLFVVILSGCEFDLTNKCEHSYIEKTIGGGCDLNAVTIITCDNCDYFEKRDVSASGHSYSLTESVQPQEGESLGYEIHTCSVCGKQERSNCTWLENGALTEYTVYQSVEELANECERQIYNGRDVFFYNGEAKNILLEFVSSKGAVDGYSFSFPETVRNLFINGSDESASEVWHKDVAFYIAERNTEINVKMQNLLIESSKYTIFYSAASVPITLEFYGETNRFVLPSRETDGADSKEGMGGFGQHGSAAFSIPNGVTIHCHSDLYIKGQDGGNGGRGGMNNTHFGSPIIEGKRGGDGGNGGDAILSNTLPKIKVYGTAQVVLEGGVGGIGGTGGSGTFSDGEDGRNGQNGSSSYESIQ